MDTRNGNISYNISSTIANSKIEFVILSLALPSCQLAVWEYRFCRTHPGLHAAACCILGDKVIWEGKYFRFLSSMHLRS
jgi:hypothetical protein